MGNHAAFEPERRVGGIIRRRLVLPAALVPALRDVDAAEAAHAFDIAEQVVEYVAPVADHIQDDATAVLTPIIPRRPLRLLPVSLEYPVTEFAAHRGDAAEETRVAQERQLSQARQKQLVLNGAMLDALGGGELEHRDRLLEVGRNRLLAIDVFAGVDRLAQQRGSRLRGRRVEENAVVPVSQSLVQVGG